MGRLSLYASWAALLGAAGAVLVTGAPVFVALQLIEWGCRVVGG